MELMEDKGGNGEDTHEEVNIRKTKTKKTQNTTFLSMNKS